MAPENATRLVGRDALVWPTFVQRLPDRSNDPVLSSSDLLIGELKHEPAHSLKVVATSSVLCPVVGRGVASSARNFDHYPLRLEQKVDSGDEHPFLSMHGLRRGKRDAGLTQHLQKAPLEKGVPASRGQQSVESSDAPSAASPARIVFSATLAPPSRSSAS